MKFKVQVVVVDGEQEHVHEVATLTRDALTFDTLGLTLAEGKAVTAGLQTVMVRHQIAQHLDEQRCCSSCGTILRLKGHHHILMHTAFGDLSVQSPRWWHCDCDEKFGTFSPLAELLPENTTPELLFLQTKWASLVSYGATVGLLTDALPMGETLNAERVRRSVHRVAQKAENGLGEEHTSFAAGASCRLENLPLPDGPLTVGLDSGFVRAHGKGWFEVIAGKSILAFKRDQEHDEPSSKCFAFVTTHDTKPRRRLFEVLRSQGMQANQAVIFMSDGGDNVRNLPLYLHPTAEHILDWFHVAMRFTGLGQLAKGLPKDLKIVLDAAGQLDSAKHHLWHGLKLHRLCVLQVKRHAVPGQGLGPRTQSG